ncbi:hypothetical protein [Actinokineospora iranica]|uniref:ABC-2 type transport system permease protein n=1 Tax=Actinokineospora iranica TaxID=1271860 RepID=A0A1G6PNA1_9PSEU|nr:hypothetical protein [Actinokineospora iranica]SDC81732.1 ABC-2 type transport system permease protein [Actinokineospora iranica]
MTLLATERIKLFTTRSPWWSTVLALGVTVGLATMVGLTHDGPRPLTLTQTQFGTQFGLMVILVMAALAVTTEYRFATIRATFQAIPNRTAALLAKTTVVALLATVLGEIAAFGSWAAAKITATNTDLALTTADDWRRVAGTGLVYGIAAVMAVAVGILVRQSAGAISVLLIWVMLVENLVGLIPRVGADIQEWLPFIAVQRFLGNPGPDAVLGPWASLAYFAGVTAVLLVAALGSAAKRDA